MTHPTLPESSDRSEEQRQPDIEDYATIEAWCDDEPVYSFGNILFVYGVSPDLLPGVVMQEGNTRPVRKIQPKKSWEIASNLCGATPAPSEPKSGWNDDQPLLPIHLIDGDPMTVWSSHGSRVPDERPEWVRIDMPAETTISAVALVCPPRPLPTGFLDQAGPNVGKQLPEALSVQISRDAWHWQTVYQANHFQGDEAGTTVIRFEPVAAKQVLIRATRLRKLEGWWNWGYVFSISGVEVRDPAGNNLALVSRGAGVAVSSTSHILAHDRITLDNLYVPMHSDLGYKWIRLGLDNGPFMWGYVEREEGKLQVDRRADELITQLNRNGLNVIMCLDIKGNWLYKEPPQKTDWRWARVHDLLNTYHNHPGWVTDTERQMEGYLHFVEYMVNHFKGRVAYWELGNESPQVRALIKRQIPLIRRLDPDTPIMLGSTSGFRKNEILATLVDGIAGVEVRDGALTMWGTDPAVAVVDGLNAQDVTVSVDIRADLQAGIVIRAQDARNYLAAFYEPDQTPDTGRLFFRERVNGVWSEAIAAVPLQVLASRRQAGELKRGSGNTPIPLDLYRHLSVQAAGARITFSVSDGANDLTTQYTTTTPPHAGAVGLFHAQTHKQTFAQFSVLDARGARTFEDQFGGPDGQAPGWQLLEGQWRDPDCQANLTPQINAIGWHAFFDQSKTDCWPTYRRLVDQLKRDCEELGFRGQYMITEMYLGDLPDVTQPGPWALDFGFGIAPGYSISEMQMAKDLARDMIYHNGMDIGAFYCNTTASDRWTGQTLVRATSPVDTVNPVEPKPAYYTLRTICTLMDGFHAAEFPVRFSANQPFDWVTFRKSTDELMVAAWMPGLVVDGIAEVKTDISLPGVAAKQAWVMDILNGTEQELTITPSGEDTILPAMLIKDYPVCVRLKL